MARRFNSVLVLILVMSPLMVGQAARVAAQDATPTAAEDAGERGRTDVRYVQPFGPDGLHPGLTATTTEAGLCGVPSTAALARPDAWDCTGAAGQIYDPCFEHPFLAPDAPGQVACLASPFTTEVVVLTLTAPLVRQKEAPDARGGWPRRLASPSSRGICPGRWSWPMATSAPCWAGR